MLNEDYKEILRALSKHKVRFLVVGAYAMAAHGYPRATGDIDIWVDAAQNNSRRLYRALAEFGAPMRGISPETFIRKGIVFQIGIAPRRIDFLTHIDGLTFKQAYRQRKSIVAERVKIPLLSQKDLIKNKRATGRAKDKVDIDYLERRKK